MSLTFSRKWRVGVGLLGLLLLAAATTSFADSTNYLKPRKITDRKIVVALVPVVMNPAYTMTINGAKKEIAALGNNMELLVRAPTSNVSTITDQTNILEDLIGRKVDAIALSTESDKAMLPYLREAAKANIPVFMFNMGTIDPQNNYYVTSIGYDQKRAGYLIGQWVAKQYPQGKIGVLEGYPGLLNTQRMDGFKEGIAGSKLQIVASQPANWNRADGQRVTEGMLTAHPEINILYGDYDEMVLGGLVIVRDRGLLSKIHIVGFGAELDGVNAVKSGDLAATITVQEYGTGFDIIDAVNDFCVKGKDVPKVIYREPKVIEPANLAQLDMDQYKTAN